MKNNAARAKYVFVIEALGGGSRQTQADGLTITDAGWAKFWHRGKLVGVVKSDSWVRIYIEAPNVTTATI